MPARLLTALRAARSGIGRAAFKVRKGANDIKKGVKGGWKSTVEGIKTNNSFSHPYYQQKFDKRHNLAAASKDLGQYAATTISQADLFRRMHPKTSIGLTAASAVPTGMMAYGALRGGSRQQQEQ